MPFWAFAGRGAANRAADRAARRHTETMAGVERRLQRILGQGYGLCCAFAMAKAVISLVLFVLETKVMIWGLQLGLLHLGRLEGCDSSHALCEAWAA